jgi:N-methylhydantoinase A
MSYRMSVDIGGTFTDLVVVDDDGRISVLKSPTTPEDYVAAVISNLREAADSLDTSLQELMRDCSAFVGGSLVHGSTIATNALIEKKVAKTGLICTRGFRDILTDREGGKAEPFNWDQDFPPPFVPRYLTLPVTERVNAEGEIETPLREEEVREAVRQFQQWGVEVIAVSLIWSIVNPVHELRVGEICREEAPEIPCVLSHQVNPIIREYRRTSSTAINASLLPIVSQYVRSFEKRLEEIGYSGGMLMLTSSGGVMSSEELIAKPIYSVDCGPSLAPTAGLWLGQSELGKEDVITADMGGTSFDISCVTDGVIAVSRDVWVGDCMLGISKVDVKSIGAGGGSIAWVDSGGLLHVGPQSAGAVPGPSCYGLGGDRSTVTDANVVLGYIDPEFFLGGSMRLRPELAEAAIERDVAEPLGLGPEQAAFTIWTTINVDMVSAIEDITVWQGIDPREYLFVSGGGAAGLHIIPMVQELGGSDILIPKAAGVISAMGGVFADVTAEFSASRYTESDRFDFKSVGEDLAELEGRALGFLEEAGVSPERRRLEFYVEARYRSQVWELSVPIRRNRIREEGDLARLVEDFHQVHERTFGIQEPGRPIECIYWRAKAIGLLAKPRIREVPGGGRDPAAALRGTRRAYFRELGGMVETPAYLGNALQAGNIIPAPAIIEEATATVVVFPGSEVRVTELGSYHVRIG